jgi:hypothetical protein
MNDLPPPDCTWREWHISLATRSPTLRQALDSAAHMAAKPSDVPLIVRLVENPCFDLPWIDLFSGAVNLESHDCIHALLGRGLLPKDEAFVIGFTMGSTNRTTTGEQRLYGLVAKYLYPGPYRFSDEDIQVFKDAAHLGYVSDCQRLDKVDYSTLMELSLEEARKAVQLECDLLEAYYRIEQKRYPTSVESQRLLPAASTS